MSGIAFTCSLVFSLGLSGSVFGQYSITGTGVANTYTQNFDAFAGTLATVPSNWTWSWNDYTPGGYYNRNVTYTNANSTHALRESASSTDVSFGGKVDGSTYFLTFTVTNNTGSTINGFELNWDVEQYTRCTNATPVSFSYRLNSGTYGLVNSSGSGTTSFTASTGTCGNTASILSSSKVLSITSITLLNGQSADFRFAIGNTTSNNAHVGIDNFTIYATAAVPTYTLTYNGNGNTSGTAPTDASSPYTSGSMVTVLGNTGSLIKTGNTFAGWTVASDGSGTVLNAGSTFAITSNTILYAKWTPTSGSNVTFNANGGTGSMSTQNASSPTNLSSNTFTRTGYTFTGWNTASNGSGTAYTNNQSYDFSADLTLFAQWSANNNTLSFNANGGTGTMASQTIATDATTTLNSNAFSRAGYTFAGWATSAGGAVAFTNGASYTMGTSNATLFAVWNANTYTVTFNGNGSDGGLMANQNYVTGATANLTANAFTRTGYTFSGWNTSADGSGTSYANSASYTMGTSNVTLFAQWTVYVGPCFSANAPTFSTSGFTNPGDTDAGGSPTNTIRLASGSASGSISTTATGVTAGNVTLKFRAKGWSGSETNVTVTLDGQVVNITTLPTAFQEITLNFTSVSANPVLSFSTIANKRVHIGNVSIFCPPATPSLTATSTSLTNLNYTVGFGPSAVQTFNLTGTNLDGSDVDLVLANTDFEISSNNTTFSNSINLPAYSGASQPIYVRLKSGLTVNSYSDVIMIAGGGVALIDEPEVSVSGIVSAVITPVITSSLTQTVEYGSSVSYQITANNTPTSFGAINLPAGLSINASGLISGTITANVGTVNTTITATNSAGTDSKTLVWTITPKALTVSGLTGSNKVYDGNTTATLSGTGTLVGVVGVDVVSLSGTPSATFVNATVGSNKPITVSGYTLSGAQAGNYTLTQPTGITANITPKVLTVTGATAQDKVYNGTTVANITGATLVGVVGADVVTISGGGTFAIADAGIGIAVTASLTLAGAQAGNYNLTQPTGLSANITKANPVFTTSTISITLGGTYSLPGANISSTSNGALSYTISSGGNATLAGTTITGAVVGSETLTVNQAASANYNAWITTVVVNVTTINYVNGDYRSLSSGLWNPSGSTGLATWERFNGSVWSASAAPATNTTNNIYIDNGHTVSSGTSVGNNFNVHVLSGGKYVSQHSSTANNVIVYTGGTFELMNHLLRINGVFEIENGATFIYNYSANPGEGLALWNGTERFHPTSNFIVRNANSGSGNYFIPASGTGAGQINSNTYAGVTAFFGNLIIDASVKDVRLTAGNLSGSTITHGNLEIKSNPIGTGNHTLIYGSLTWTIGGDLIIGQNTIDSGTTGINISSGANTITWNVKGNFINNSGNTFRIANNATANVTLNVDGDVILNSGTVDLNATTNGQGTVNMKGNFTVATGATYTATQSSTAKTIFSGGNVQNVSGAGTINVYYMEVNKTGGYVNLLRDLQAKIQLTMTQGHVYTNANLLELGESTVQKGTLTYTSGYVVGIMRRWFNGTNSNDATGLFPMGQNVSGMKNRFARVYYNDAPTNGGHLTVEFISTFLTGTGFPISAANTGGFNKDVINPGSPGYWRMDNETDKLDDGSHTISLTGEGFPTITNINDVTIIKRVGGGDWFCPGTHASVTGTAAMPTLTRTNVVGWSNYGFGGGTATPLPVELISFHTDCQESSADIRWSTASELNSYQYVLENSRDLNNWFEVTTMSAAGNSNTQLDYYYSDQSPFQGISYYRLRQIDFNGAEKIYGPISVSCNEFEEQIEVYPNPAKHEFTVAIQLTENKPATTIQLMDVSGKIIHTLVKDLKAGNSQILFNDLNLPDGAYLIQVISNESHFSPIRLVIAH